MDQNTDGSSIGPLFLLGAVCALLGWIIAKRKGLDPLKWAIISGAFAPALIWLMFQTSKRRPAQSAEFENRWRSLAAYDPEIKAAVDRLSQLGPAAVAQFKMAYGDVQTKDAIPLIVADIKQRWAAGDRFEVEMGRFASGNEDHRSGSIPNTVHRDPTHPRLAASPFKAHWSGWWWASAAVLVLLFLLWPAAPLTVAPECTDGSARDLVRRTIENGPKSKLVNIKLVALDDVKQVAFISQTKERHCSANALLNSGVRGISWSMSLREGSIITQVYGL